MENENKGILMQSLLVKVLEKIKEDIAARKSALGKCPPFIFINEYAAWRASRDELVWMEGYVDGLLEQARGD